MHCWTKAVKFQLGLVLIFTLIAFSGCSSLSLAPRRTTLSADRVDLPTWVDPKSPYLFVEARINGAGPFRLLVDTGADFLIFGAKLATAAGLKYLPDIPAKVRGASGTTVPAQLALVERFDSGGLSLSQVLCMVLSQDESENLARLGSIDGVLGMAALWDVILEMDFPKGRVTAVKPGAIRYPAGTAVSYTEIAPVVRLELSGRSVAAVIDTGSDSVLSIPLDAIPLFYPPVNDHGIAISIGHVGKASDKSQLSGEAQTGPVRWIRPPVQEGEPRVGARALETWKLAIDQRARKIYFLADNLRREWPAPIIEAEEGFKAAFKNPHLVILEVVAESRAARAGLRKDDLIVSVGGVPAAEFATRFDESGDRKPSPTIRVRRGEVEFEVKLAAISEVPVEGD